MIGRITADDAVLVASVKLGEGLRLRAYPDPESPLGLQLALPLKKRVAGWQNLSGSPWTLGYGHTGGDIGKDSSCTKTEADGWLTADLIEAMAELDRREPWWRAMTSDRQRVLAEMCFNLGYGRLCGFHRMMADLQAGNFAAAADEMDDSRWARQIGDREKRLSDRMRAG